MGPSSCRRAHAPCLGHLELLCPTCHPPAPSLAQSSAPTSLHPPPPPAAPAMTRDSQPPGSAMPADPSPVAWARTLHCTTSEGHPGWRGAALPSPCSPRGPALRSARLRWLLPPPREASPEKASQRVISLHSVPHSGPVMQCPLGRLGTRGQPTSLGLPAPPAHGAGGLVARRSPWA